MSIKHKYTSYLLLIIVLFLYFLPLGSFAQRTEATGITYECGSGTTIGNCTFNDLIAATLKVVNWAVSFALFLSVFVIAYAGYKYMISGNNPGERAAANKMLQSVAIGIIFIIAAWLIVNLITFTLMGKTLDNIF